MLQEELEIVFGLVQQNERKHQRDQTIFMTQQFDKVSLSDNTVTEIVPLSDNASAIGSRNLFGAGNHSLEISAPTPIKIELKNIEKRLEEINIGDN